MVEKSKSFERVLVNVDTEAELAGQYNVGILYMADQQYAKAISAFDAAARLKPRFERAEARARQARALAGPITEDLKPWNLNRSDDDRDD